MTVLQALDRYYGRMAERGDVVAQGYSVEPIGVVVVLKADGSIVQVLERLDPKSKKGLPERVPKWFGRQGNGSTPYFLWDNTAYALGVSTKDPGKTKRDHEAFRKLHLELLAGEADEGLVALRRFIESWTPEQYTEPHFNEKMLAFNIAFRLDGDVQGRRLIHERPASGALVERLMSNASSEEIAFCLVTGSKLPIVRLHPKVKGVNGTASAEVPLVSFNENAFESYSKTQGYNAPTSEQAAFRYTAALNSLLDRGSSRNRLKRGIGDATVIFWADTAGVKEASAKAGEDFFANMVEPPDDESEAVKVRDALELVAAGRPIAAIDPQIQDKTKFHVLGLAPNAARLSVRYWLSDDLGRFAERLARHYAVLRIEPVPRGWTMPPVGVLLARTTALQGKFDNIPPLLAGEVMRAVLTGSPYPRTLLTAAIIRLRASDDPGSGWHAAVVKACLNSNPAEKDVPVALEPENLSVAYQLGRLFAVLESAQFAALGQVRATIGDRYYAAASATPARVFGPLLRGLKIHASDARKRGQGGWIEPKVAEIIARLPVDLPRTLRLEDQARFAVGYYHERAERWVKSEGARQAEAETNGGNNQ